MKYQELFIKAYKGKKVLITGHTGFKGAWLLTWLHSIGANIKGYALAPENSNDLYCLIDGDQLCDSIIADIRDIEKLNQVVQSFEPDYIFHLAAQPLVIRSYNQPMYTFDVNVMGTVNLLEVVRGMGKKCNIVLVTTDKVYENQETGIAYQETDKLGGYDPYSASKAAAEIVISSYRSSFFNPANYEEHQKVIASARAGNVIGGGDRSANRIIPDIINAIEQDQPIIIRNPSSVRPWQFVLEPLNGYLVLGALMDQEAVKYATAWNFGPYTEDVLTVKGVVEKAILNYGKGSYLVSEKEFSQHEAKLLQLDISKALCNIGWKPKFNADTAIEYTINWYKNAQHNGYRNYTISQINSYTEF